MHTFIFEGSIDSAETEVRRGLGPVDLLTGTGISATSSPSSSSESSSSLGAAAGLEGLEVAFVFEEGALRK